MLQGYFRIYILFQFNFHYIFIIFLLFKPLEVRESNKNEELIKLEKLGYWHQNLTEGNQLIQAINAIEIGRIVTRDIGGSDPERMSAENVLKYVQNIFQSTDIKITVVEGQDNFEKGYPCFAAVNRAANGIEFHFIRL